MPGQAVRKKRGALMGPDRLSRTEKKASGPEDTDAAVLALLTRFGADTARFRDGLLKLEEKHGADVYACLIQILTHLDFSPARAKKQWAAVCRHQAGLEKAIGRPMDFRIALADYFVNTRQKIKNPMILELQIFRETREASIQDALTGLFNFRYLNHILPGLMAQARRSGNPLSLIFLDVDDFKSYNDRYGHTTGNDVLCKIARVALESVREMDVVFRYGGEEIAILLPASDKFGALAVAERIRTRLESLAIPAGSPRKVVTVSGGVAAFPVDAGKKTQLLQAADSAMYRAKSLGKNRVELFSKERRAHERKIGRFQGEVTLGEHHFPLDGKNLATGGLYLVCTHESVALNQTLDLHLRLPSGSAVPAEVLCRGVVTRREPLDGGCFGLGIRILHMSADNRRKYNTALALCGQH